MSNLSGPFVKMLRLKGPEKVSATASPLCLSCGAKSVYQQPDFDRRLGVAVVSVASLLTCVFLYFDFNWWLVWSPMLVALVVDRIFAYTSPMAVICYRCSTIHRGFAKEQIGDIPYFSLEEYDRHKYPERMAELS